MQVQVQFKGLLLKITCLLTEMGALVLTSMPTSIDNKEIFILCPSKFATLPSLSTSVP